MKLSIVVLMSAVLPFLGTAVHASTDLGDVCWLVQSFHGAGHFSLTLRATDTGGGHFLLNGLGVDSLNRSAAVIASGEAIASGFVMSVSATFSDFKSQFTDHRMTVQLDTNLNGTYDDALENVSGTFPGQGSFAHDQGSVTRVACP
jgi:hypothetical protein